LPKIGKIERPVAILVAVLAIVHSAPSHGAPLTPQEEHGRQIYHQGSSPDGAPIHALVGRSGTKVPAGVLVCASCHGEDGLGRPEGGVEPSNVTWTYLTKSYGHQHASGRRHPAFDEASLAAAITDRVDPAGNDLDPAMPGYEMSDRDLAALIAYLKRLEVDLDPGLSETAVRVGTLLPREGRYAPLGQAVAGLLRAYFDEINGAGGIYGRRLELEVADYAADPAVTAANARHLIEEVGVFAVLGAFVLGMEGELFAIFEAERVPQVGPFTLFAEEGAIASDATFFVEPGLPDQARALVDHAARTLHLSPNAVGVVLSPGEAYGAIARAAEAQAESHLWPRPLAVRFAGSRDQAARLVGELKRAGVEALLYFGPSGGLSVFMAEAATAGWTPHLLLSGVLAGRGAFELPLAFDQRVFLAYPRLPSDGSPGGAEDFRRLRDKHGLPDDHRQMQIAAYVAASIFVEGLRRAGRALSRAGLVAALEGLSAFETGLARPVTYGPNRRVGTLGAHVVAVNLKQQSFRPGATWVRLD
jgi:ABC-type branched-subunit amino acid transport system substrate-binding protein